MNFQKSILAAVWTPFDAGGAWKIVSATELQAAGFEIDWNKYPGRGCSSVLVLQR